MNRISLLYTPQGHKIVDPREITVEIQKFYMALLGTAATHISKPDLPTLRSGPRLSRTAAQSHQTVPQELGFPQVFVKWIMTCLTTVSYSILINGFPSKPFQAKKGLRQGDPLSPFLFAIGMEYLTRYDLLLFARADKVSVQLLLEAFSKFSSASGLEANMDKSNIYFAGVSMCDKTDILSDQKISEACLPFRYLGVPLSSKKLSYPQCKPLEDKILARTKVWSAKFLSYAGRLLLIKTIVFGMQTFWCQIFILPKRIIKEVEAYCRCLLWTGDTAASKKALVAWDKLYQPRNSGGWNVKNIAAWNKVAIGKLLWALAFKKDKLWVQWVDSFYMKGQNPLQMSTPGSCSWALKKIFNSREVILQIGGWDKATANGKYCISKVYKFLQGVAPKVTWWRVMCYNKASPKSLFITWLAILNRLYTTDRLQAWGIQCFDQCVLCTDEKETVEHLFFECKFPSAVWSKLFLQGVAPKVTWWRVMCYNKASPKSMFITWLAILNRLYTTDRLQAWGIQCSDQCVLCTDEKETVEHLFFECKFSSAVWSKLLLRIGVHRGATGFASELQQVMKRSRKVGVADQLYVMCFTEAIYSVWLARNAVIFKRLTKSIDNIVREILFKVCCRGSEELRSRLLHI
ncbi:uncharacterized protein [Spinacia oleracea]|uniref:Reverse transcriptase domain-containing protein n=1 Tax=Spinacia oleracea TaxID=3562 RepID=A0ABM3QRN8_SPIOL|nr:uncharacterized protein LOC130461833 [Spinacia oleracea]